MELWIRSQNKQVLTKCEEIELVDYKDCFTLETIHYRLGTYKTKERALEVLDEIQDKMRDRYILQGSSVYPTPNVVVYEMPKE